MDAKQIWAEIGERFASLSREELRAKGWTMLKAYCAACEALRLEGDLLVLGVPAGFYVGAMCDPECFDALCQLLSDVSAGAITTLKVEVDEEVAKRYKARSRVEEAQRREEEKRRIEQAQRRQAEMELARQQTELEETIRRAGVDSALFKAVYVTGQSNRYVAAAIKAVQKDFSFASVNPLVITGPSGAGLTMAAMQIAKVVMDGRLGRILWLSGLEWQEACEAVGEQSHQVGKEQRALKRYELVRKLQSIDGVKLIILDRLEAITGKMSREWLLKLLGKARKVQVILTSTVDPKKLFQFKTWAGEHQDETKKRQDVSDSLRRYFQTGLCVPLEAPDLAMRREIARTRLASRDFKPSPSVLDLLARRFTDAGLLIGALNSLMLRREVDDKKTIDDVMDVIRDGELIEMSELLRYLEGGMENSHLLTAGTRLDGKDGRPRSTKQKKDQKKNREGRFLALLLGVNFLGLKPTEVMNHLNLPWSENGDQAWAWDEWGVANDLIRKPKEVERFLREWSYPLSKITGAREFCLSKWLPTPAEQAGQLSLFGDASPSASLCLVVDNTTKEAGPSRVAEGAYNEPDAKIS